MPTSSNSFNGWVEDDKIQPVSSTGPYSLSSPAAAVGRPRRQQADQRSGEMEVLGLWRPNVPGCLLHPAGTAPRACSNRPDHAWAAHRGHCSTPSSKGKPIPRPAARRSRFPRWLMRESCSTLVSRIVASVISPMNGTSEVDLKWRQDVQSQAQHPNRSHLCSPLGVDCIMTHE